MTPKDGVEESLARLQNRITIDDLRHKALAIRDTAKEEALAVLDQPTSRYVLAGALVFAIAVSVAYVMGSQAARQRAAKRTPPPQYPARY